MFNEFYFSPLISTFQQLIQHHSMFSTMLTPFGRQITQQNLVKLTQSSYTTKQTSPKQQVIILQKQQNQIPQTQEMQQKVQIEGKRQNKSIFHNYQKHLITTLKQKIVINQKTARKQENQCKRQIWLCFNKSKIANRTLLLATFGEQDLGNDQLEHSLSKSHMAHILARYSLQEVKQAQREIREVVIQYFESKSLDEELEGRKLQKREKEVFKHYVVFFLAELAAGRVNKRLPKRYKQQMKL